MEYIILGIDYSMYSFGIFVVTDSLLLLLLQVMASKTKIYFVLEFVTGGELFDKIVSFL